MARYYNPVTDRYEDDGQGGPLDISGSYQDRQRQQKENFQDLQLDMMKNPQDYSFIDSLLKGVPGLDKSMSMPIAPVIPEQQETTPALIPQSIPSLPKKQQPSVPVLPKVSQLAELPIEEVVLPQTPMTPEIERFKDDELARLQQETADKNKELLLMKAFNKIGASVGGYKEDTSLLDAVGQLQQQKISDLLGKRQAERAEEGAQFDFTNKKIDTKNKQEETDPNSEVSKAYRDQLRSYLKDVGLDIKIPDQLSYAQLQKQFGILSNRVSAKEARDARALERARQNEDKQALKNQKLEEKALDFAYKASGDLEKNAYFKNYNLIRENDQFFKDAINNPSGIKDLGALYKFVKFLDQESAVREGEIDLLLQSVGGLAKIKQQLERGISTGDARVLPDSAIKKMYEANEIFKSKAAKNLNSKFSQLEGLAEKRGLAKEDMNLVIPGYEQYKTEFDKLLKDKSPASSSSKKEGKSVIKREFSPSRNQTRITYSDGSTEVIDGKK